MGAVQYAAWHFVRKRHRSLARLGVISALIVFEMALGWLVTRERIKPEMMLAVAVIPVGLLAFYRLGRFEYGVLALVLAAGLVNFVTLPTGNESRIVISLVVAMGLAGLWIVQLLVVDKRIRLEPSPVNLPILAFAVISIFAYAWSNAFRDPLVFVWGSFPIVQLAALLVNVLLPLLVLMMVNKVKAVKWLRWLTWIMIGMGSLYIVAYFTYSNVLNYILNNGSSGLFAMWVVALAYALALFDEDLPVWQRALLLGLVAVWLYRNLVEGRIWLSGWVPMLVACAAITFLRSRQLFLVVLLLVGLYVGLNYDFFYRTVYVANVDEGGLERLNLWRMNLAHVANHPLFGMGPAGYAVYNMTYHPEDARSTHNNYFDVLAQTGVVGFAAFLWLFATFLRTGLSTSRVLAGRRNFEEAFSNAVLGGCVGVVVAMMLGDWVLPFAYNSTIGGFDHASYTWVLVGGLMSLHRMVTRRSPGAGAVEDRA